MTPDQIGKLQKIALMTSSFSPAAPVDDLGLFAYRDNEIAKCISAIFQRGLHIGLYGERGVGKTTLANLLPKIIREVNAPNLKAYRIDCNTEDTFESLWRHVFREIGIGPPAGFEPEDIRRALAASIDGDTLIVIDELDRMQDDDGLSLLADTVKTLADHSVRATLMLVGVADSLMELMGEHASIVRSILQVQMPRMSPPELENIIDKGLSMTGTRIHEDARSLIVSLSEGLPHYTHLLAQTSGIKALQDDRDIVQRGDVLASMREAVETHSYRLEYDRATSSPQPGTLYSSVLLACTYAQRDDLGFFRAADVREPLSIILDRGVDIPTYQGHLNQFTTPDRGAVLTRAGAQRRYRYRFSNPLLQPYTKIRAISAGLISEETRTRLEDLRRASRRFDATGQGQLFEQ